MMSVVIEDASNKRYVVTKSAPDVLLVNSKNILLGKADTGLLSVTVHNEVKVAIDQLASQAPRTIAMCLSAVRRP